MVFQGEYLTVDSIDNSILELCFTSQGSVNKFNQATLKEFGQALSIISDQNYCQGLMLTTAKDNFIVGADITEFTALFKHPRTELLKWLSDANAIFNTLEDLPFPTISVIQGYALGGGCECVLATDFRIADASVKIGLPETKLGLIPGFGGTVRLPRLIGADNALEWIATGREHRASECFKVGVLDALNETDQLKTAALVMLKSASAGDFDWQKRRIQKKSPLLLDPFEVQMSFATAAAFVTQQVGPHYPAPMAAVRCVESAVTQSRPQALLCESEAFADLAPSQTANALIGLFLNDQYLKNIAKQASKSAPLTTDVAVIGAGIMGGGIAYQAAYCGKRVVMKDIQQKALDQGMQEAGKLLSNLLAKQKMSIETMAHTLSQITPSLDQNAVRSSQVIIEAVVEKQDVKQQVLRELEDMTAANTILTSNTSTIPISALAKVLSRPQQFCGMHFFNPVHKMPLVEVIRGENTSQETIDAVVALAAAMRKSPIVVKDCPGFFVNRVLFPYLFALGKLIDEGVDYQFIDKVMEKQFGWPMGPAYLLDVIGLDTAKHAGSVMAKGFPDRMGDGRFNVVERLLENNCLGQKNGLGFYCYTPGKKGKPKKTPHLEIQQKLYCDTPSVIDADTVIARMMIPMLNEVARCLDEGIIDTPAQADMALVYGLGFPPFRGGACRYIDHTGVDNYVKLTERFSSLSPMYAPGEGLVAMARKNDSFYPDSVKGV